MNINTLTHSLHLFIITSSVYDPVIDNSPAIDTAGVVGAGSFTASVCCTVFLLHCAILLGDNVVKIGLTPGTITSISPISVPFMAFTTVQQLLLRGLGTTTLMAETILTKLQRKIHMKQKSQP